MSSVQPGDRISPTIQVSWGELIDKITILEIKEAHVSAPEALANVRRELAVLVRAVPDDFAKNTDLIETQKNLRSVNQTLWEIEDRIRAMEAAGRFDQEFIELARSVYIQNDQRARLKRGINGLMKSDIVEEKQYVAYDQKKPSAVDRHLLFENRNLRVKRCKHGVMMFHANDSYIGRSLDLYGEYSEGETDLFKQLVRPGMSVVDAGANIGAHTIYFSKAVRAGGRVLAFEPQRVLYQVLCGNATLNGCTNVTAVHAALGAGSGSVAVPPIDYTRGGNFGGVALGTGASSESVPLHMLDSYSLKACHFMKIDVEGMERDVLEGAKAVLAEHRPILYVENDRVEKSEDLIKWLMASGYRLYWHLPPLFNAKNFYARSNNVFGKTISVNMICIPRSSRIEVQNFREVTSPAQKWHT